MSSEELMGYDSPESGSGSEAQRDTYYTGLITPKSIPSPARPRRVAELVASIQKKREDRKKRLESFAKKKIGTLNQNIKLKDVEKQIEEFKKDRTKANPVQKKIIDIQLDQLGKQLKKMYKDRDVFLESDDQSDLILDFQSEENYKRILVKRLINYILDNLSNNIVDELNKMCPYLIKVPPPMHKAEPVEDWIQHWKKTKGIILRQSNREFNITEGTPEFQEKIAQLANDSMLNPEDIINTSKPQTTALGFLKKSKGTKKNFFVGTVQYLTKKDMLDELTTLFTNFQELLDIVRSEEDYDENAINTTIEFLFPNMDEINLQHMLSDEGVLIGNFLHEIQFRILKEYGAYTVLSKKDRERLKLVILNDNPIELKNMILVVFGPKLKSFSDQFVNEKIEDFSNFPTHVQFISSEYMSRFSNPNAKQVIEYWWPKIHFVTGKPVFKIKPEIKRITYEGKKIYLKLSSVMYQKEGQPPQTIYYFRKFINFNDFLMSWFVTYEDKLEQAVEVHDIDYYSWRIEDIVNYFREEYQTTPDSNENAKLNLFIESITQTLNGSRDKNSTK
jgi:hypothetical protein